MHPEKQLALPQPCSFGGKKGISNNITTADSQLSTGLIVAIFKIIITFSCLLKRQLYILAKSKKFSTT